MSQASSIRAASQALARFWANDTARKWVGVAGFLTSLVPVPGVQQAGQIADRLASNADTKRRMEAVWDELTRVNSQLGRIDDLETLIARIATTVQNNDALQAQVRALAENLSPFQESFTMLAERGSLQNLINSLVEAHEVSIVTQSGSRTEVSNTTINARRTHLHTTGNSQSLFNNTHFRGQGGAIGMNNIRTQGNITVQGSGIGFGEGSGIVFGEGSQVSFGGPAPMQLACPRCNSVIPAPTKTPVLGALIVCPRCGNAARMP